MQNLSVMKSSVAKHYGCNHARHCGPIANGRSQANQNFSDNFSAYKQGLRNMNCCFARYATIRHSKEERKFETINAQTEPHLFNASLTSADVTQATWDPRAASSAAVIRGRNAQDSHGQPTVTISGRWSLVVRPLHQTQSNRCSYISLYNYRNYRNLQQNLSFSFSQNGNQHNQQHFSRQLSWSDARDFGNASTEPGLNRLEPMRKIRCSALRKITQNVV